MRDHESRWRVMARYFLLAMGAIALMAPSCGDSDDAANDDPVTPGVTSAPDSTSTPVSASTSETDLPVTAPDLDGSIVAYVVTKESFTDPTAIDVTFTNKDGDSETEMGVALPWQAAGFVGVGTLVSLKAETRFVEVAPFSCTLRANGRVYTKQSQAVTDGNDIVGAKCEVGPITAEAVVG